MELHFKGVFSEKVFDIIDIEHRTPKVKGEIRAIVQRLERDLSVFNDRIETIGTTMLVGSRMYRIILSRQGKLYP